jgi:hypothetical protein
MSTTGTPIGWTEEEWDDFEDYLMCLSNEEYLAEITWIESVARAKMEGKNICQNDSYFMM